MAHFGVSPDSSTQYLRWYWSQYLPSSWSGHVVPPYFRLSGYGQKASSRFPYIGNQMMYPQDDSNWPPAQLGFRGMIGDFDDLTSAISPFGFGYQSFRLRQSFFGQLNQLQDLNNNGIDAHLEITKSKINNYLAKMQQLGNRKLSVQVDYLNSPLEYQYLSQYHGFQDPLPGTSRGDYLNVPKPNPRPLSTKPSPPNTNYSNLRFTTNLSQGLLLTLLLQAKISFMFKKYFVNLIHNCCEYTITSYQTTVSSLNEA